jgi:hypothetical protein
MIILKNPLQCVDASVVKKQPILKNPSSAQRVVVQQKAPKLFISPKDRLKFPGAYDERATRMVKIFVHLDEPKAKNKGGSPSS